jgi:hypothetical protein
VNPKASNERPSGWLRARHFSLKHYILLEIPLLPAKDQEQSDWRWSCGRLTPDALCACEIPARLFPKALSGGYCANLIRKWRIAARIWRGNPADSIP